MSTHWRTPNATTRWSPAFTPGGPAAASRPPLLADQEGLLEEMKRRLRPGRILETMIARDVGSITVAPRAASASFAAAKPADASPVARA